MGPNEDRYSTNHLKCTYCTGNATHLLSTCDDCIDGQLTTDSTIPLNEFLENMIELNKEMNDTNEEQNRTDGHKLQGILDLVANHVLNSSVTVQMSTKYMLFGTYLTDCRCFNLSTQSIKLIAIKPNLSDINFKYHITVPFGDIQRVMYCRMACLPLVLMEVTEESNKKIQVSMQLGFKSAVNGFKFNVNSDDIIERYIAFELENDYEWHDFIDVFNHRSKVVNKDIIFREISEENSKKFLKQMNAKSMAAVRRSQLYLATY
ncbi:unnamed protein product [Oppiella nova]|uniref:Uncharacterized protein n=1 Tax=Oppiella nova TaxID=334625 RepID=A0A7R9M719_9ACAR|nr:unnamed protein product [Oppiella nova]CAG2170787.1 unnamed protein product [Oppiella nova]